MGTLREDIISQIRACLISTKGKCDLRQIRSDYGMLMGGSIPYSKLGYNSLEEFICSIPSLTTTRINGQLYVDAKITEKSLHISTFVEKQKPSKKKRPQSKQIPRRYSSTQSRWLPKTNNTWKNTSEISPRFAAVAHTQLLSSRLTPTRKVSIPNNGTEEYASTSHSTSVISPKEPGNSLALNAKRRLSQKMADLNLDDVSHGLEDISHGLEDMPKISSNLYTNVDNNTFKRTGNHLTDLRTFAIQNNLSEPIVKTIVHTQRSSRNSKPTYYCKIQIDDFTCTTYPVDSYDEESAKQMAAKKALDGLEEKRRIQKQHSHLISEDTDILQRIPSMIKVHHYGIWNHEIEEKYLKEYNEQLPTNWLEIVDSLPNIAVIQIHDQFVLNYCDPADKQDVNKTLTVNVSVLPNALKFNEDGLFLADITCIASAAELWCSQRDTPESRSFSKMTNELETYYNLNNHFEQAVTIQIGGYYVAIYEQMWCRVRVFEVDGDDIHCFCIDFGDEWVIKKHQLFNLNKNFANEPAQAFVCRLAGVEELYEASKNFDKLQTFIGRAVQVQVESNLSDSNVLTNDPVIPVVLYDLETGSTINEEIITLISMEMALPTLTINTPTEAYVSYALNDGTVYIQIRSKGFQHLMSLIEKAGQNILNKKTIVQPLSISKSSCNEIYFIQSNEDKMWHRVRIIDWSPYNDNLAQIMFVDTGKTSVTNVHDINFYALEEISDVLNKFPTQGFLVRLMLKNIPDNFVEKINELMPPDEAILVKSLRIGDDYVPLVEFFKRSESDNVLFSVNMTLTESFNQNGSVASGNYNGKSQSKKLQILKSLNQFKDVHAKNVPSTGSLSCPKLPEIGDFFDVVIPCAVHPCNFFVQPYESRHELNNLMDELQRKYQDIQYSPLHISDVSPGKIYASRHKDGKWYRTSVIKVIHSGSISVFYCDFGYYGNLSVHDLIPIDDDLMNLPYQALKAKLAGVQPKNSNWSMEDCKYFADLVCKKSFVSVLISIEKDLLYRSDMILNLKLVDTSTNEDIHLDKLLVRCGIALSTT